MSIRPGVWEHHILPAIFPILWAISKAFDGIIDLPLAAFADKLHTRFGRRKTAILVGLIPTVIAYCLFLIPLEPKESYLNTLWFGALLIIFYACYTLTMLTYYATFSEVCENESDALFLSNSKSICDVVYFSLSFALVPVFIGLGVNIRIVSLIFLPLVLTMLIPFFLLKSLVYIGIIIGFGKLGQYKRLADREELLGTDSEEQ